MYVCLCKGITDSAIRRAVQSGIQDFRALRQATGLAAQCGRCACNAREVLRNIQQELSPASEPDMAPFYAVTATA